MKTTVSLLVAVLIFTVSASSSAQNSSGFWENRLYLKNTNFSDSYPKPFMETDAFTYTVIGGTVAAAAAVTIFTAGAGAPAVAAGSSPIVVAIGGGSQGAYMAGLSTIGSYVGSNAIAGAALVNGLAAGVGIGGTSAKLVTAGSKAMFAMNMAVTAYDGILLTENPESKEIGYILELQLPKEMGGKKTRALTEGIFDLEKKVVNADNKLDRDGNMSDRKLKMEFGRDMLVAGLQENNLHRDDYIVLGIIAYKLGDTKLFQQAVWKARTKTSADSNNSFLDYLWAYSHLLEGRKDMAVLTLYDAITAEPGVVETANLLITLLAEEDFTRFETKISDIVRSFEEAYDDDSYSTAYTPSSLYFRLGSIYYGRGKYHHAIRYFEKAKAGLNWVEKWAVMGKFTEQKFRNSIDLAIANSLFNLGQEKESRDVYSEIFARLDNEESQLLASRTYLGDG